MYLVQESQSESNDLEETSKLGFKVRPAWLPVDSVWDMQVLFQFTEDSRWRISSFVSLFRSWAVPIGVELFL